MIQANEARARTTKVVNEKVKKERQIIGLGVVKATEMGVDHCYIRFPISNSTLNWLKALGYKVVQFYNVEYGWVTKITW